MMRKRTIALALLGVGAATLITHANGRPDAGVVYVTSQGLYYDSFVVTQLPPNGPFQQLFPGDPSETEFGPGDPGYVGGRWWVDVNEDGEMDDGDNYFLCPLLPPGRETID